MKKRSYESVLRKVSGCTCLCLALVLTSKAGATVIVNDSWADGGRDDGADPQDSNWWTSASSSGIEVSVGSLGMVTGSSGRGIHTIFPTQTLANVGDKLVATYTFTTPAVVGRTTGSAVFRVGFFDTLGRAGLNADVSASSGSPNDLFGYFATNTPALPGYMMDHDIGTGTEDLNFRQHDTVQGGSTPTGRLMATTSGFTSFTSGPDGAYTIEPNTTYTGTLMLTRESATELEVAGSFGSATHSVVDEFDSLSYGMFGFHANSNIFGVSNVPGEDNNGIDFSNITIEFFAIPEPSSLMLLTACFMFGVTRRNR